MKDYCFNEIRIIHHRNGKTQFLADGHDLAYGVESGSIKIEPPDPSIPLARIHVTLLARHLETEVVE